MNHVSRKSLQLWITKYRQCLFRRIKWWSWIACIRWRKRYLEYDIHSFVKYDVHASPLNPSEFKDNDNDPEPQPQQPPPTELKDNDNDHEPQSQQPPSTELKDNDNDAEPQPQLSKSAGLDFNPDSGGILNNDIYVFHIFKFDIVQVLK